MDQEIFCTFGNGDPAGLFPACCGTHTDMIIAYDNITAGNLYAITPVIRTETVPGQVDDISIKDDFISADIHGCRLAESGKSIVGNNNFIPADPQSPVLSAAFKDVVGDDRLGESGKLFRTADGTEGESMGIVNIIADDSGEAGGIFTEIAYIFHMTELNNGIFRKVVVVEGVETAVKDTASAEDTLFCILMFDGFHPFMGLLDEGRTSTPVAAVEIQCFRGHTGNGNILT